MAVTVKDLNATIELKNKGMELEIRNPKGEHQGDVVMTKSGVTWCKGKTKPANGVKLSWEKFAELMEGQAPAKKPAAKKTAAAKKAPAAKKAKPD